MLQDWLSVQALLLCWSARCVVSSGHAAGRRPVIMRLSDSQSYIIGLMQADLSWYGLL